MRVLDLFSGIGGFSLGLERAGMRTVAFCEWEEYCRAVIAKHWAGVPCYGDIRELTAERLEADGIGPIDLICGGYPCQPFSQAGQRRGQEDHRHLWPEFNRLVAELRPAWVIGENVAGHISMGLDDVLSDLEGQGYTCRPFVIPAVAVDAKHRRDRVWVLARSRCVNQANREKGFPNASKQGEESGEWREGNQDGEFSALGQEGVEGGGLLANPDDQWQPQPGEVQPEGGGRIGNGCRWQTEPDVGRVAHGIPRRVDRLRALGNAVVPQIPEIIGRAIMEAENVV